MTPHLCMYTMIMTLNAMHSGWHSDNPFVPLRTAIDVKLFFYLAWLAKGIRPCKTVSRGVRIGLYARAPTKTHPGCVLGGNYLGPVYHEKFALPLMQSSETFNFSNSL